VERRNAGKRYPREEKKPEDEREANWPPTKGCVQEREKGTRKIAPKEMVINARRDKYVEGENGRTRGKFAELQEGQTSSEGGYCVQSRNPGRGGEKSAKEIQIRDYGRHDGVKPPKDLKRGREENAEEGQ